MKQRGRDAATEQDMFESEFTIEWGDCDEAGIVFYPNYFYWFDCTFQKFLRSRGLSQREVKRRYEAITPLVDVGSRFLAPARYDDVVRTIAKIETWQARRFRVTYTMAVRDKVVAEGFEERAWAKIGTDGRLSGAPVEEEFKTLMS